MKHPLSRRSFLGQVSTACAAAASVETALQAAGKKVTPAQSAALASDASPSPLPFGPEIVAIENEGVRVEVARASGALKLIDRHRGQVWGPDPWLGTAGLLTLENSGVGRRAFDLSRAAEAQVARTGDKVLEIIFRRLSLPGGGKLEAQLKVRLALQGDRGALRLEILALDLPEDWHLVELEYPCRLGPLMTDVDDGYLVLPYLQGCLVPSTVRTWKELPHLKPFAWDDGPWMEPGSADLRIYGWQMASMPFFGAVKGASAFTAIIETENDASLRVVLNSNGQQSFSRTGRLSPYRRVCATSPLWLAERRRLGYPRAILYEFLASGDYVAIAKHYRRYAKERGLLVTLREKIERTPALATIIGGPWVHMEGGYPYYIDHPLYRYTWQDARKLVDDLADYVDIQRALLTLWIGYQNLPPDFYPFHPAQGSLEDLRDLVQHAKQRQMLVNFYHGYPALLDDAPNGDVARARKLDPQGSMGQRWGRHCPAFFLEYARKNLPGAVRDSGIVCDYTDILTSTTLGECWDARHPLTRTQDRQCREETMKYINSLGLFSGSEWPVPYSVPYLSYFRNGGAGAGSHLILGQFPVPLFNLVFKDCALMYAQFFPVPGMDMVRDLAAGCHFQLTFWDIKTYYTSGYDKTREGARANVPLFQDWNHATGLAELVSHEFIHELNGPYRTRFTDGSEALVNTTTSPRQVDSQDLPPESILLRFADGRTLRAAPKTGWNISAK